MKHDKESIQRLIRETVSLLCRNSLSHDVAVRIQGLIGITIDSEVLLVHFDESYGNEHGQDESTDVMSSTSAELPTSNPRKRRRLEETTVVDTSCNTESARPTGDVDCDVIFVADDENENDVKLGFDEFYSSVDNYDQMGNSLLFKAEDTLSTTDLNTHINSGENHVGHSSRGNVLLRNMLADHSDRTTCENSYLSDQSLGQSESVLCEGTTVQTTCVKRELTTTTRPRVKQVPYLLTVLCLAIQ